MKRSIGQRSKKRVPAKDLLPDPKKPAKKKQPAKKQDETAVAEKENGGG